MSTAVNNSAAQPAATPRVPPEEPFWKRYSPHGEMPLSMAGSVALHALAFGLLLLFGLYLVNLFVKPQRTLPVEPVRLMENPGGGGPRGGPEGVGRGEGPPPENVGPTEREGAVDGKDITPERPALTPVERKQLIQQYDKADARFFKQTDTDTTRAFARLNDGLRRKIHDGLTQGRGKGGSGSGGGRGSGTGTGEGSGKGAGKATLSQREKRMLRWTMRFSASNGPDYVRQLAGLGAILAIPLSDGADPDYRIVRDLSMRTRPAPLLKEDISKIQRIYWIDDKPRPVGDVMSALGLNLHPRRFVAFMPESLEKKLFDMEREHMTKVLGQKFDEERIYETVFEVVQRGGGYQPRLVNLVLK